MKRVGITLLGSTLDRGDGDKRWNRWRPSVALAHLKEMPLDRLELIHGPRDKKLLAVVEEDIREVAPDCEVVSHEIDIADPWDFEQVYSALHDFARAYSFKRDESSGI